MKRQNEQYKFGIKKALAFTLAEVLITLGIIGVVAAMTIPTLMSNTNSAKFRSQYKKTFSTLNQAIKMNMAQNEWDISDISTACGGSTDDPSSKLSMCALFNGTLTGAKYIDGGWNYSATTGTPSGGYRITKVSTATLSNTSKGYMLADGSMFFFYDPGVNAVNYCSLNPGETYSSLDPTEATTCQGYIDVNGMTLPNKEVRCSDGTAAISDTAGNCVVDNKTMGDVFPVFFHDGTIEPLTNAARAVLYSTK